MGCTQSSKAVRRGTVYGRRNTLVVKPNVNIKIGEGINLEKDDGTRVIFIFGGPGSGKGTIVDNLVDMYNFRFVCGEDLILEKLSEILLVNCPINGTGTAATQELQKHMQDDSSQLTLRWVLGLIDAEIEKFSGDTILVDIVPNLKFLLRVPTFMKNCEEEMRNFEKKYPVALAVNLALDQDHLLSNINQTHACTKAPSGGQTDDKGSSDEMDTSRTQRRFNIYLNSVKDFISYFEDENRLLNVDTSCGRVDVVWETVRNYVYESEISEPIKGLEQVLLMKMCDSDFEDVDRERYPMLEIKCQDLLPDDYSTASPDKLLKKIVLEMRNHATRWKTFLIDVINTSLCSMEKFSSVKHPQLMFVEVEVGQLDYFMHGLRRKTQRKKSLARKQAQFFKSVCTGDNEALIFPESLDTDLCHRIGLCYLNAR